MKKLALAAAMALALGGTAKADLFDYANLFGGATIEPDLEWCFLGGCSDYEMQTGFNVGGALGWNVADEFAVETEVMYTQAGYSCCNTRLETFSVMLNGVWHFDIGSSFTPFVGAGIGGVQSTYSFGSGGTTDFVFGAQGFAGISIPLNDTLDLYVEYKYQWSDDASGDFIQWEYQSNNVDIGLHIKI